MMDVPKIAGFEILETMPQGAMGTVYKARQISLDRIVALKTLPRELADDSADIEQFLDEARITANLKHSNIVQVYDFGKSEEGIYFFVMEFISGYSVGEWIRRKRRLSEENSLLVAQSVSEALQYAWDKDGVIHCDIKPDNIMIDGDGTVKVTDLGLAKSMRSVVDREKTVAGIVCGTPNYISPEQSRGDLELDQRTDIYSLGAMLYHSMTGKMPFEGDPLIKVMDLQITEQIPDPQDLNPAISTESACLIEKMMAKDRDDRQQDWMAVHDDIARVMDHRMPAGRLPEPGKSTIRRSAERGKRPHLRTSPAPQPPTESPAGYSDDSAFDDMARMFEKKQKQRNLPRPELIAASVIGLAILVLGALVLRSTLTKPDISPTTETLLVDETPAQPDIEAAEIPKDDLELREMRAAKLFADAMEWLDGNREHYDEAIKRFEQVADETSGTRYSEMAFGEMELLKAAKQRAIESLIRRLDEQAEALAAQHRRGDAASLFERYEGPLAKETEKLRQQRALKWREREQALAEIKILAERKQAKRQKLEELTRNIAADLVDGDIQAALVKINDAMRDEENETIEAEIAGMEKIVAEAARIDKRILDSFAGQKDREVTLNLTTGPEKLTIRDVKDSHVEAEKIVILSAGHASHPRTIRVSDLAPEEKRNRLGPDDQPETALMQGLVAVNEETDLEAAREFFRSTCPTLSDALVAEIDMRLELQNEEHARQTFIRWMRAMRVDIPDEIPPPGDCVAAIRRKTFSSDELDKLARAVDASVREQLLLRNPELTPEDIVFRADSSGTIVGVEIRSPALRDIQPLASLRDLQFLVCSGRQRWHEERQRPMTAALSDISPLKGLKLRELNLAGTEVRDIMALSGMPLRKLDLSWTKVNNLQPLAGMPLTDLDISRSAVRDIRILHGMPLERLNISGTSVDSLIPLREMKLSDLDASDTRIRDVISLRGMPLKSLNISDTGIVDIGMLREIPLTHLMIARTQVRDITPLTGMSLESLDITGINIRRLDPLKGMQLVHLAAGNTGIAELAPLDGMSLRSLSIENTNIRDISVLSTMPLIRLNLDSSRVDSLEALAGLPIRELNIRRTEVKDLGPLAGMPLKILDITHTSVSNIRPIQQAPIEHIHLDPSHLRFGSKTHDSFMPVLRRMPNLRTLNGMSLFEHAPPRRQQRR